jgi:hypothetical protein
MRHCKARQLSESGKWHYTCRAGDAVYPIGYCSKYASDMICEDISAIMSGKNDCPGHDTAEEAENHYKQYVLDRLLFFSMQEWPKYKCKECNNEAKFSVSADGAFYQLCEIHANKETVSKFLVIGESWES